jgi:hypothetical protein
MLAFALLLNLTELIVRKWRGILQTVGRMMGRA